MPVRKVLGKNRPQEHMDKSQESCYTKTEMEIFPGVSMAPDVRFGKPCITGTRVDVATIVSTVAAEESIEGAQEAFQLTHEQVLAALRYAAHIAAHLPPAVERVS